MKTPVSALPAPAPAQPPIASADVQARLAQLEAEADAAHAAFITAAPRAHALAEAGSGADIESDAWAAAQIALADLDSQRSQAATALGDLDVLFVEATLEVQAREEIDRARQHVITLLREEDRQLAELRAKVR